LIVLDTHIWVWWANQSPQLLVEHRKIIGEHATNGLGVSIISCWEVAKLVEKGRLKLTQPVDEWISIALQLPSVVALPLTPAIAIESTRLPAPMHADPADQMIVATARILQAPLLTADQRLIDYQHVPTL
jgi:PIN domain nuclease of toxin-antitoxin system